eukprot:15452575-Alexandrium_andersonii.AAC.1
MRPSLCCSVSGRVKLRTCAPGAVRALGQAWPVLSAVTRCEMPTALRAVLQSVTCHGVWSM